MKKIVYIGNNLESGNPTTLVQLSEILKAQGYMVSIFSNKRSKVARLLQMCSGILKHTDADFILIDTYSTLNFYYALVISQLSRVLQIKYIPILHGGNLPARLQNNPFLSQLIFKNAFVNVAPSSYLKSAFETTGFQTVLIPNAIEINKYPFLERTLFEPKLLWVRAFDAIYNPKMAIDVLIELKKTQPFATLCMVGPDKDGSMLDCIKYIHEKELTGRVELTGYLTKTAWIEKSKATSFFINTTNFDNSPVSVVEAMALGLPIISTNVGGLPLLITANKNGVLVKKGNVKAMTNAIEQLIQYPEVALELAINARKTAAEFDIKAVSLQWKKLLEDV